MPSRGLADVHPLLNRRRPQRVAVQDVGLSFVAPRHFAEDQALPRRVAAVDEAVLYRIGPLDQMLEIMETISDPCDLGQRQSHVDAELPETRSEESRVGQECVSTCRSRWSPSP